MSRELASALKALDRDIGDKDMGLSNKFLGWKRRIVENQDIALGLGCKIPVFLGEQQFYFDRLSRC